MALAWKRWLVVLGVVLGVRLLNPVNVAVVDGRSMEPAMHDGQLFLIDRLRYRFVPVARGDVVAFHHGNEVFIKRVAAIGGDELWVLVSPDGEHIEWIPHHELARMRVLVARHPMLGRVERRVVPAGHLFVMGDHRHVSYDSRSFGPIPVSRVIGRAIW